MENKGERVGGPPLTRNFEPNWTGKGWKNQGVVTRSKAKSMLEREDENTSSFSDITSDASYQGQIERLVRQEQLKVPD